MAAAKKVPPTSASQKVEEAGTVVRRSDSRQESNQSTSGKDGDLKTTLNAAAAIEDRNSVVEHYLENRNNGLSQDEAKRRALSSVEDERAKSADSAAPRD